MIAPGPRWVQVFAAVLMLAGIAAGVGLAIWAGMQPDPPRPKPDPDELARWEGEGGNPDPFEGHGMTAEDLPGGQP